MLRRCFLLLSSLVEVRICHCCYWKQTVTVSQFDCGFFESAEMTKLRDRMQVGPQRVNLDRRGEDSCFPTAGPAVATRGQLLQHSAD